MAEQQIENVVIVGSGPAAWSAAIYTARAELKPLVFEGRELVLNVSTSAAGSVLVEIQNAQGRPMSGFGLGDAVEIFGDEIELPVRWKGGSDVSSLSGKPVCLRFLLRDADLYSLRFRP